MPCVVLDPGVSSGMPILYDNPKEVGADRIANAVGAYDLYGGPCVVVDLGTATTFDAISSDGEYLGGAIAPGVAISMDALFHHAAALRAGRSWWSREASIGKSTVESIQSGALYGFAAQVDGMCRRIIAELGQCDGGGHRGALGADRPVCPTISSTSSPGSPCTVCAWSTSATSGSGCGTGPGCNVVAWRRFPTGSRRRTGRCADRAIASLPAGSETDDRPPSPVG